MDILAREDLPFPQSLPEFQRIFPDDAACAAYLESARWKGGFACARCGVVGEPFRFEARPGVLRCRACRKDVSLMAGTVMERSHTPLSTWFWAAYLIASQTPGMSAVQFQRQLGLSRYETAFGILHNLRAGLGRPERDKIGGKPQEHVEVDETWVGGRTNSLCGFVENAVAPGSLIVTDDWSGYAGLRKRGFDHHAIAECGDPEIAEEFLPIIHLVFANLKTWINGVHHGVSAKHLQAYLNEFTFRFNRRFYPFNAFRSLLGIAGGAVAPTFEEFYSREWAHPTFSGCG